MGALSCRGIRKKFGDVEVLKGVQFEAREGKLVVLLGPSGCGKSTLLRIIAGLEVLDEGEVLIDSVNITRVHPRDRNVAMVFQNYALFPLMSVRENLSFGMRINKVAPAVIKEKVARTAEILGMTELLDRKPAQLSGGQRQRVAMGRAMVRDPRLFLFDEPLSNLDAKLRSKMRGELKTLHQKLEATTVYVTHDQMEAMTMADHLIVMRDGVIEQDGTPADVYHHPKSVYTASFLGSPEINLLEVEIAADGQCSTQGSILPLTGSYRSGKALCGVRPHDIELCGGDENDALHGRVVLLEPTGGFVILHMEYGDNGKLVVQVQGSDCPQIRDPCAVRINPQKCHLFEPESGGLLVKGATSDSR